MQSRPDCSAYPCFGAVANLDVAQIADQGFDPDMHCRQAGCAKCDVPSQTCQSCDDAGGIGIVSDGGDSYCYMLDELEDLFERENVLAKLKKLLDGSIEVTDLSIVDQTGFTIPGHIVAGALLILMPSQSAQRKELIKAILKPLHQMTASDRASHLRALQAKYAQPYMYIFDDPRVEQYRSLWREYSVPLFLLPRARFPPNLVVAKP